MNNIYENIINEIPKAIRQQGVLTPYELLTFLAGEMDVDSVSKDWRNAQPYDFSIKPFPLENMTWSVSDKLRVQTGKYYKSFMPNDKDTLTKVTTTDTSLKVDFGSKLPRLHESGGFIKSKGKMQYWFFYQYARTKNPFFKIMGSSVMKKGGVNVKARPHFNPAIEKFKNITGEWLQRLLDKILEKSNV